MAGHTICRDDCDLWWDRLGDPAAPALVLGAGLGGTASWWAPQAERYARQHQVILFDQRGTGRSSRMPVASIEQMAEDLRAVLDAAGVARAQFLGHSTGGAIFASLAMAAPERVASLIIYASTTHGDAYRRHVLGLRQTIMREAGVAAYARFTTLLLYPPYWMNANADRVAADEAAAAAALGEPDVQASRLDAILAWDRRDALPGIAAPTLVLCADDDILTPRYFSEDYARLIPGARAHYEPRGGHALSRTEPEAFDAVVLPFLAEHRGRV